jgi:hypothetical protein
MPASLSIRNVCGSATMYSIARISEICNAVLSMHSHKEPLNELPNLLNKVNVARIKVCRNNAPKTDYIRQWLEKKNCT